MCCIIGGPSDDIKRICGSRLRSESRRVDTDGVRFWLPVVLVVLYGCAGAGDFERADEVCVDFYRSAMESIQEEAVYHRRLADEIIALGHDEAGSILSDLADEWEVGEWSGEGDETEVGLSARYAEAGKLLGEAGAVRCIDLAEWWGIDGYEGEPDPDEMLARQAGIWETADVDDYKLLVATTNKGGLTQIQVDVVDGEVAEVIEIQEDGEAVDDLPTTIGEIYGLLETEGPRVDTYDLIYSAPRTIRFDDGTTMFVHLDEVRFPNPIIELDVPEEALEEEG